MHLESDEMHTRYLFTIGKSLISHAFGAKKPAKPVKEKEFMKFLNQEKKEKPKKVASFMDKQNQNENQNQLAQELSLEDALKLKQDPTKMLDNYQPIWVEKYWYKYWEERKYFHPDANEALKTDKRYIMVIPPPKYTDVTGYLHLGHALTSAIEDCLIRLHRQRGFVTLYLPGIDHAGIATQTVVEKALAKQGISKYDLGREKFLEKVWEWKHKHGNQIDNQLRRVGSSLDWDRYRFTMDEQLQKSVTEAFIKLQEKGLIYRANRLVNWSCKLKTAISDIEVEFQDIEKPISVPVPGHTGNYEFGWLTHFAYKVADSDEEIVVATTRLETMLGDVAVAVNSQDPRYKHLHGKKLIHPFIKDRLITVICDDILVDMGFGTGAVKVTPAHDPNDYECGTRNNLPQICIFTDDGRINEQGGQYAGLLRFDCRKQMEEDMKKMGIFRKKEVNKMRIGFCQRSKDVVEPMIKPQWYVDCQKIKQRMIDVVRNKELIIVPNDFEQTWYNWLTNLRDWCISRQIWWGHRCPAYLCTVQGRPAPDSTKNEDWVFARSLEEAQAKAEQKYGVPREQIQLFQDEDVLDTWFSSGLFPFSTMGWPDTENPDFKAFFPNTILETGWDILFFWVARMVHFSLEFFDTIPFKYVFLHPIIRDKDGKKMSKSSGNVIDPLEIIEGTSLESLKKKILEGNLQPEEVDRSLKEKEKEFPEGIPECGSDALRFGLLSYMQKCTNVNLDVKRIIGYRQFCNKIWQSIKFALPKIENVAYQPINNIQQLALINGWILTKLNYAVAQVNFQFNDYEFGLATQRFHNFWQYELCDVYLEGIKHIYSSNDQQLKDQTSQVLMTCLEVGLRLLHPMMPFLSEELWQKLPKFPQKASSISIANYPEERPEWKNEKFDQDFEMILSIARSLRQMAAASNLPSSARPETYLISGNNQIEELVQREQNVLISLSRTKSVQVVKAENEELLKCAQGTVGDQIKLYLNLKGQVDVAAEVQRLENKLKGLVKQIENLEKKQSQYSDKVPEKVRVEDAEKLQKYLNESEILKQQLANLNK